jgi:DNA helicase-2/ATP-dependent DNA helicase PcrA
MTQNSPNRQTIVLSAPQQAAVEYVGTPAIVTAGAGSGKTRTLTEKIRYLITNLHYPPESILAITFTNKAANEIKERLMLATGRPMSDFPWVRTFHSASYMMLKQHCELLGFERPLMIFAESQQKSVLKKVLAELEVDKKHLNPAAALISLAKNSGDPEAFLELNGYKVPKIKDALKLYNEAIRQQNAVDFDDILLLARDLLRDHPEVCESYQRRFRYILIDEFQDTAPIQAELVDLLVSDGNLTVVGDDYQAIYQFRGATPSIFVNFPDRYKNAQIFRLEQNYRSTQQIVRTADVLIANNAARLPKTCYSEREGQPVLIRGFRGEEEEAFWVAQAVERYRAERVPLERIAVLYRAKHLSRVFEAALRAANIPYAMMGGRGFFERREVRDVLSYLICSVNLRDDASFERILNVPKRGIGAGAVSKLQALRGTGYSLQEIARRPEGEGAVSRKAAPKLRELLGILAEIRKLTPEAAVRRVIEATGYEEYMRSFCDGDKDFAARSDNLEELAYAASKRDNIVDFLEECALLKEDTDDSEEDDQTGVRLSTIHAAKGLEYRVVFVVAAEDGVMPHHRAINAPGGGVSEEGVEEERRLFYVAMTRAADLLHISWSALRRREMQRPSRFLHELPTDYLRLQGIPYNEGRVESFSWGA